MRALRPSMLRRALVLTLPVLLAAMALTAAGASAETRIIGGSNAAAGQFPYQVMVKIDGSFACGGSILDATHVATAAHCAVDFDSGNYPFIDDPDRYSVLYGGVDSDISGGTTMSEETVTRMTVDRHYQRRLNGDEYDTAILTLASPLTFDANTGPIALATATDLATARGQASPQATVSGWGDTINGVDSASDKLKFVKVPLDSDAACRAHYGGDFVASVMLCAGSTGKDTCQGDSGGPLKIDVGGPKLAGITSFGDECGVYPGVYTRVSEAYTRSLLANPAQPAPPSPSGSPTVSGTLRVGRDVTCNPPGGGAPSQYFWYLVSDDDEATQFEPSTRTVRLPADAAGARVACDVRLENNGGFAYAEMATEDAVGPIAGNGGSVTRDRTKPKVRVRRIKCRRHRCKITVKASDRGGTVKHVAGVVNGKRRACRVRHGSRRCRLKGIRTKHLKLHKKRGGIYVARVKLRRGRYSVRVRSRDSSRNLSKRVKKKFRVR